LPIVVHYTVYKKISSKIWRPLKIGGPVRPHTSHMPKAGSACPLPSTMVGGPGSIEDGLSLIIHWNSGSHKRSTNWYSQHGCRYYRHLYYMTNMTYNVFGGTLNPILYYYYYYFIILTCAWRHTTTENNAKNNKNARFKSVNLKKILQIKKYNFGGSPY